MSRRVRLKIISCMSDISDGFVYCSAIISVWGSGVPVSEGRCVGILKVQWTDTLNIYMNQTLVLAFILNARDLIEYCFGHISTHLLPHSFATRMYQTLEDLSCSPGPTEIWTSQVEFSKVVPPLTVTLRESCHCVVEFCEGHVLPSTGALIYSFFAQVLRLVWTSACAIDLHRRPKYSIASQNSDWKLNPVICEVVRCPRCLIQAHLVEVFCLRQF